jgi:dihydroneopterin aldolase
MPESLFQSIALKDLQLPCHIGVPAEERAQIQVLLADISLEPATAFAEMEERLERTIDYAAVAIRLRALAAQRPRLLLETLADEMARCLIDEFGALQAKVVLRKMILPDCGPAVVSLQLRA